MPQLQQIRRSGPSKRQVMGNALTNASNTLGQGLMQYGIQKDNQQYRNDMLDLRRDDMAADAQYRQDYLGSREDQAKAAAEKQKQTVMFNAYTALSKTKSPKERELLYDVINKVSPGLLEEMRLNPDSFEPTNIEKAINDVNTLPANVLWDSDEKVKGLLESLKSIAGKYGPEVLDNMRHAAILRNPEQADNINNWVANWTKTATKAGGGIGTLPSATNQVPGINQLAQGASLGAPPAAPLGQGMSSGMPTPQPSAQSRYGPGQIPPPLRPQASGPQSLIQGMAPPQQLPGANSLQEMSGMAAQGMEHESQQMAGNKPTALIPPEIKMQLDYFEQVAPAVHKSIMKVRATGKGWPEIFASLKKNMPELFTNFPQQ